MKIPKRIKIGGHWFKIFFRERGKKDGVTNVGSCESASHKIWIEKDLPQSQVESVLLHEIIEALNYHYELKLPEQTICTLETGLYQVLKDNNLFDT